MNKYCISLLLVFSSFCHGVIEGSPNHDNLQELSSVMPDAVDLELGCRRWHEDSPLYLQGFTAISNALCVIARACSNNSSALLFLSHIPEGSGCSTNLEASDGLKILPLEEDVGWVLGGEVRRPLEGCMGNYFSVFSIGLVDFIGRNQLRSRILGHDQIYKLRFLISQFSKTK